MSSIAIGKTVTGKISPTGPGGESEPVNNVQWSATPSTAYSVSVNLDGTATFTATEAASGAVATVTAQNVLGVQLSESGALPDVLPPAASALNLTLTVNP